MTQNREYDKPIIEMLAASKISIERNTMTETCCSVVYRGKILTGFTVEAARRKLIEKFAVSEKTAEKILNSRGMVLKKNLGEATARRLTAALQKAGLDVAITRSTPKNNVLQPPQPAPVPPAPPASVPPPVPASGPSVTGTGERIPFHFHGSGSEYFRIWLVNSILSLLTLGIYSAWAKVRRKRYFYGNTRLHGDSFEYLADPVKILKGRIITAGILVVCSVVANLSPVMGPVLSLLFLLMLPWLVVRSLAFNARNSAFRNIHFAFDGRLKAAAKVYLLWPILAVLTVGVLGPHVYFRQKQFIVKNSRYGTTRFSFIATSGDYYRMFFSALIPMVAGGAILAACVFVVPPLAMVMGLGLYLYLFAFFSVYTTNLFYRSSHLAAHRFEADLKIMGYFGLVATNSLGIALTLGLFYPWARIRILRYKLHRLALRAGDDLEGFIAGEQEQISALGGELSDFMDFDFSL